MGLWCWWCVALLWCWRRRGEAQAWQGQPGAAREHPPPTPQPPITHLSAFAGMFDRPRLQVVCCDPGGPVESHGQRGPFCNLLTFGSLQGPGGSQQTSRRCGLSYDVDLAGFRCPRVNQVVAAALWVLLVRCGPM